MPAGCTSTPTPLAGHNERLEFLGDAVVNLIISEALYTRHPDDDEGDLSARRAAIVSTPAWPVSPVGSTSAPRSCWARGSPAAAADDGRRCWPPRSRRSPARSTWTSDSRPSATGSWSSPRQRAVAGFADPFTQEPEESFAGIHTTAFRWPALVPPGPGDRSGPRATFRIEVSVDGVVLGVGEGPSRRTAETAAASEAMERLWAAERPESIGA